MPSSTTFLHDNGPVLIMPKCRCCSTKILNSSNFCRIMMPDAKSIPLQVQWASVHIGLIMNDGSKIWTRLGPFKGVKGATQVLWWKGFWLNFWLNLIEFYWILTGFWLNFSWILAAFDWIWLDFHCFWLNTDRNWLQCILNVFDCKVNKR